MGRRLLYILGLRVAGEDEPNSVVLGGGARPLLREPATFEVTGAGAELAPVEPHVWSSIGLDLRFESDFFKPLNISRLLNDLESGVLVIVNEECRR